jgi:hypothetical protein
MINKEDDTKQVPPEENKGGILDTAYMDVQCHIIIKDKDTGIELVNKRG